MTASARVVVERTRLTPEGGAEGTGRVRGGRGRPGREIGRLPGDGARRGAVRRGTQCHPARRRPRAARRRPVAGEYVAGWIKRGPTGIIGTNKKDAVATVASLLDDAANGRLPEPATPTARSGRRPARRARGVDVVTTAGLAGDRRRRAGPRVRPAAGIARRSTTATHCCGQQALTAIGAATARARPGRRRGPPRQRQRRARRRTTRLVRGRGEPAPRRPATPGRPGDAPRSVRRRPRRGRWQPARRDRPPPGAHRDRRRCRSR